MKEEIRMIIKREINGEQMEIKLTDNELWDAYREAHRIDLKQIAESITTLKWNQYTPNEQDRIIEEVEEAEAELGITDSEYNFIAESIFESIDDLSKSGVIRKEEELA